MPVYEAVKRRDLQKITDFINAQFLISDKSLPSVCWHRGFGKGSFTVGLFQELQTLNPDLRIYWAEDAVGSVRVVVALDENKDAQQICHMRGIVKQEDFTSDDGTYFLELCNWIVTKYLALGYTRFDSPALARYFDWVLASQPDAVTIMDQQDDPEIGRCYYVIVDLRKWKF